MAQYAETAKKNLGKKKKKEKKKRWRCSSSKTRLRRPRLLRDLGRSAIQAGARPRSQRNPGLVRPLFLFLGFFFFFFSSLMNTYFLLLWFSFAVSFVFYFNCKSSLRDSISMQMPRGKSATSDVNNPSKSSLKNSIYRP